MEYYNHKVPKCKPKDSLESMFDKFRKGDSHMAFVYADDIDLELSQGGGALEVVGIVTLENIIEELVQSEIMDEADKKREKRRKRKYYNNSHKNLKQMYFTIIYINLSLF